MKHTYNVHVVHFFVNLVLSALLLLVLRQFLNGHVLAIFNERASIHFREGSLAYQYLILNFVGVSVYLWSWLTVVDYANAAVLFIFFCCHSFGLFEFN